MAKYGSDQVAFFLLNGRNLLGTLTQLDEQTEAVIEETTPLGAAFSQHTYVGLRKAELSQDGYYDDAAGSAHEALSAGPGQTRVLTYGVEGNSTGKRFMGWSGALQVNYQRLAKRGELTRAAAKYSNGGGAVVEEGRILHPLSQETSATGNSTGNGYDQVASGSSGGAGYLQVSDLVLGGFTSWTARILHSADNLTYAALLSFSALGATGATSQRVAVSGSVNRYLAHDWAFGGVSSTVQQAASYLIGFARS